MMNNNTLKEIDQELTATLQSEEKTVKYLEELEFTPENIDDFIDDVNDEILKALNEEADIVKTNIKYLKDLGIKNYQEGFIRFYNMFLIEPKAFDEIFSKYDKEDLIIKLEKNIAIMEHL